MKKKTIIILFAIFLVLVGTLLILFPRKSDLNISLNAVAIDRDGAVQQSGKVTIRGQRVESLFESTVKMDAQEIQILNYTADITGANIIFQKVPHRDYELVSALIYNKTENTYENFKMALALDRSWCVVDLHIKNKDQRVVASTEATVDHAAILKKCSGIFD